jgi:predicted Zn finger-like uncharacterized protein
MKIKCDSCGAKYQIADEKVKHRIFKIRCKRCENVIVVHAEQGEEDPTVAVSAMNEQALEEDLEATKQVHQETNRAELLQSDKDDAVWHVVVNREQVGPVTPQDVAGYLGRGEITGDAFVWRDGIGDWCKLSTIPAFAHLFGEGDGADVSTSAGSSPFSGASQENPFAGQPAVGAAGDHFGDQADDDVMMSEGAGGAGSPGLFAGVDAPAGAIDELAAEAGGQLANQRNENSVLFSLDDLENQNSRVGVVTNTGGSDASGLIDISLLGQSDSGAGSAQVDVLAPSTPAVVPASMPSLVTRKRSNLGLIIGLSFGGLVLASGIGVAVFMALSPAEKIEKPAVQDTKIAATSPKKITIGGTTPSVAPKVKPEGTNTAAPVAKVQTVDAGQAKESAAAAVAATAPTGDKKVEVVKSKSAQAKKKRRSSKKSRSRSAKRKKPSSSRTAKAVTRPAPLPIVKPRPAPRKSSGKKDELDDLWSGVGGTGAKRPVRKRAPAAAARPAAAPAASDNPLLAEKLSRRQVLSVVRRNARSIADCKNEQPDLTGTVMVDITIAGSGRVQRAKVITGKFSGTGVGRCVESRVKTFRFPRFGGSTMKLKIPFGIR